MKLLKRTWADVSLDNLAHNYTVLRQQVPAACRFLGVVKADAYGHGAVPVSHHLEELGAEFLAVSNLEEAVQLVLDRVPGASSEDVRIQLEEEDGRQVYEGEVICNRAEHEFEIDAFIQWSVDYQD